jgi:hypothetical protein
MEQTRRIRKVFKKPVYRLSMSQTSEPTDGKQFVEYVVTHVTSSFCITIKIIYESPCVSVFITSTGRHILKHQ